MKKSIYALTFVVLALTLHSCDWFEEATSPDFSFNTPLSVELEVETEASQVDTAIVLDPLEDDQIAEYKDDIKGMEVKSIGFKVKDLSSDHEALIFNGDLKVSIGAGAPITLSSLEDIDIKALADSGEETTLDVPSDVLEDIAKVLESKTEVTLYLSGSLSDAPSNFTLELIADLKVTTEVEL